MVLQRACAFATYTTREGAEKAAEELANKLVIKGVRLKLMWGKPHAPKPEEDEAASLRSKDMLPMEECSLGLSYLSSRAATSLNLLGWRASSKRRQQHTTSTSQHHQQQNGQCTLGALVKSQEGDGKPGPQQEGQGQPSSSSGQSYPVPPPYYHGQYPPYGGFMRPPRMPYPPYQSMLAPPAQSQASSSQHPAPAGQQQAQVPPPQPTQN